MNLILFLLLALAALKLDGVNEPNQVTWFGRWDCAGVVGSGPDALCFDEAENN